MTTTTAMAIDLRQVAPQDLRVVSNYRRRLGDLEKLTANIAKLGVLQPVIARPVGDGLDLVVGHRRRKAAMAAELDLIPVLVRDLDDDQVLDLQVAENLNREDVSPIDEAEAFGALHDRGDSFEEIAERFGRSPAWIARRVQLRQLSDEAATWLADGRLPVRHAAALSVASHDDQDEVLRFCYGNVPPLNQFRGMVERRVARRLKDASFDTASADLDPEAGACTACPFRTSAQPTLFEDDAEDDPDRCLRPSCWDGKVTTTEDAVIESLRTRHGVDEIPRVQGVSVYGGSVEYSSAGAYVALGNAASVDGKSSTWRKALPAKKRPAPDGVSVRDGKVTPIWKVSTLRAAAKEHGIKVTGAAKSSASESQKKARVETMRWKKVGEDLFATLPAHLTDAGVYTDPAFARMLASFALGRATNEACKAAGRRRGLEQKSTKASWGPQKESWSSVLQRHVDESDAPACMALTVEVLAFGYGIAGSTGLDQRGTTLAKYFGFDVKAARKAVLAEERKAARKPKKAAAKKKAPRKRSKKPRPNPWKDMTPEQKKARVQKMLEGRGLRPSAAAGGAK